jgi:hypothetical protein
MRTMAVLPVYTGTECFWSILARSFCCPRKRVKSHDSPYKGKGDIVAEHSQLSSPTYHHNVLKLLMLISVNPELIENMIYWCRRRKKCKIFFTESKSTIPFSAEASKSDFRRHKTSYRLDRKKCRTERVISSYSYHKKVTSLGKFNFRSNII